jgi:hypothetical protein
MTTRIFFLLLFLFVFGGLYANIETEFEIVIVDSIPQYRYLSIVSLESNDTLRFDPINFNAQERVNLFFKNVFSGKSILLLTDYQGQTISSKPFKISNKRNEFLVFVQSSTIDVTNKTFLYPLKNENKNSYYVFLLLFFVVKMLISYIFISISKLQKRIIFVAAGTFLISSFIDWIFPINYVIRFVLTAIIEYLLITVAGAGLISWKKSCALILVVNIIGFGIIAFAYTLYIIC